MPYNLKIISISDLSGIIISGVSSCKYGGGVTAFTAHFVQAINSIIGFFLFLSSICTSLIFQKYLRRYFQMYDSVFLSSFFSSGVKNIFFISCSLVFSSAERKK
jgi:hypothetical protein